MPLCFMHEVTKSYQIGEETVKALRGIDLSIDAGELVAIMGTSGSGKTTLMNLIGCLDVPTSGRYVLADEEVSRLSDDELSEIRNQHIGFVFQSFYLLPYASVLENVLLPTLYKDKGRTGDEGGRPLELLRLVGLEDRVHFRPNQLSGGQQQRVAIARALVNDPEILLADEPTGQLDSKTAGEIMALLTAMNGRGKTVIVVTHDADIAAYAHRIIHIKDGMIVD
jgi:putative ABC transport system ATP-binding protein